MKKCAPMPSTCRHFWMPSLSARRIGEKALQQIKGRGCELEAMNTSYFLPHDTIVLTIGGGMAPWREKLFAQMHHNASGAADFLNLPNNAVVELGSKIEI